MAHRICHTLPYDGKEDLFYNRIFGERAVKGYFDTKAVSGVHQPGNGILLF